jgi:pimeloyl-ACP methyl ester carboxylesterase
MNNAKRFITRVHDTDIHWAELGEGRPLVLLHGLHDSHRTWRRVGPALARNRRVLMPDLPGHGLSARPDASYELAWYAQVMGAWFDALGLEDADVVGHSFGGGLAQYLVLERRARIRRLGLVAAGGLGSEVGFGLRLISLAGLVEHLGQPFLGPATRIVMRTMGGFFDPDDIAWLSWVNSMPGSAMALGRTVRDVIDWRGQKRRFVDHAGAMGALPPVALYWGDRDGVIPVAHALAFEALVDGAAVTHFPGCGHFPQHERAEELAAALGEFIEAPLLRPAGLRVGARLVRVSA